MYQWQGDLPEIAILNGRREPQPLDFNQLIIQLCHQILPKAAGNLLNKVLLNPDFAMMLRISRDLPRTYLDYEVALQGGHESQGYWIGIYKRLDFGFGEIDRVIEFDNEMLQMKFRPLNKRAALSRSEIFSRQDFWTSLLKVAQPARTQLFNLNLLNNDTAWAVEAEVYQANPAYAQPRYRLSGNLREI